MTWHKCAKVNHERPPIWDGRCRTVNSLVAQLHGVRINIKRIVHQFPAFKTVRILDLQPKGPQKIRKPYSNKLKTPCRIWMVVSISKIWINHPPILTNDFCFQQIEIPSGNLTYNYWKSEIAIEISWKFVSFPMKIACGVRGTSPSNSALVPGFDPSSEPTAWDWRMEGTPGTNKCWSKKLKGNLGETIDFLDFPPFESWSYTIASRFEWWKIKGFPLGTWFVIRCCKCSFFRVWTSAPWIYYIHHQNLLVSGRWWIFQGAPAGIESHGFPWRLSTLIHCAEGDNSHGRTLDTYGRTTR